MQESRAQVYIKKAEGEVAALRNEFDRWDNIPPSDEVTYELGRRGARLVVECARSRSGFVSFFSVAAFYMPEAVYPRVWDKDEHDKLKDVQFLPYQKRDSLRWWVEQGGELMPHKHEWIVPDEALDPIGAPSRPNKVLVDAAHGHGAEKKIAAGGKH